MSTSFTIWHYLSFLIISALFVIAILYTLKQKEITQKGSFIALYSVIALLLLIFCTVSINKYTKQVVLTNVKHHRFLSMESIIYTGRVRNTGSYDVGQVEIEIELFDKGRKREGRASFESTAFKDHYNGIDIRKLFGFDDPDMKPTTVIVRKRVAEELKAGKGKQFTISIRYPSYFTGYISQERIIVH